MIIFGWKTAAVKPKNGKSNDFYACFGYFFIF